MSLLANDEAVPSRVTALYRWLSEHEDGLTEPELMKAVWPEELIRANGSDLANETFLTPNKKRAATMGGKCLNTATSAGLIRVANGVLQVNRASGGTDEWDHVAKLILQTHTEDNLDLLLPLAWFLMQEPMYGESTFDELARKMEHEFGGERLGGLKKIEDYRTFLPWVTYLGLARETLFRRKLLLVPDPTRYLSRVIDQLLPVTGEQVLLAEFLAALATRCPVWPRGSISLQVSQGKPAPTTLYWSESTSLLRLHERGSVQLHQIADAPQFRFVDASEVHIFASISRGDA